MYKNGSQLEGQCELAPIHHSLIWTLVARWSEYPVTMLFFGQAVSLSQLPSTLGKQIPNSSQ